MKIEVEQVGESYEMTREQAKARAAGGGDDSPPPPEDGDPGNGGGTPPPKKPKKPKKQNEAVIIRALAEHPDLQGVFWYDEFRNRIIVEKNVTGMHGPLPRKLNDFDTLAMMVWMQNLGYGDVSEPQTRRAIYFHCQQHRRNPLLEHLEACRQKWIANQAGPKPTPSLIDRLYGWTKDHLVRTDEPEDEDKERLALYYRTVARNDMLGAVRRYLEPGTRHEEIVALISQTQGDGKSEVSRILAMRDEWFHPVDADDLRNKDILEQMQGRTRIELAEGAGAGKSAVFKSFVTKVIDMYRKSYGHENEEKPRQFQPMLTTNNWDFYTDPTGMRRINPIGIVSQTPEMRKRLRDHMDLIVGEAMVRASTGEPHWMNTDELREIAKIEQDRCLAIFDYDEPIRNYIARSTVKDPYRRFNFKELREAIVLYGDSLGQKGTDREITKVMVSLGYEKTRGKMSGSTTVATMFILRNEKEKKLRAKFANKYASGQ